MHSSSPTPFGLWLSLLAIGLTLSMIFNAADGIGLRNPEGEPYDLVTGVISLLTAGACLVALVLLMKRKRLFVPVMIGLLAINLLIGISALAFALLSEDLIVEPAVLIIAFGVQSVIACLWIAYLLFSERVREVCVN